MEKIFAVYAEVEIPNIPDWLVEFRKKYSEPYDFHITLKQPVFIEESEIPKLKEKLRTFFEEYKGSFSMNFNENYLGADKSCIMLGLKGNSPIVSLQRGLVNCLDNYNEYVDSATEKFENNFVPHITIGDKLNKTRYEQALKDLPKDFFNVKGVVNDIVLVVVKEATVEEALKPENLTKFTL